MRADIARVLTGFRAGLMPSLARAVSIVENHRPGFDQLLATIHADLDLLLDNKAMWIC